MRAPAPVRHPVACGGFWWAAWQSLALVAAAAVLIWLGIGWRQGEPLWALGVVAVAAGGILSWSLAGLRSLRGWQVLVWDGQTWCLHSRAGQCCSGRVRVALDLGPWMLMRWQPDEGQAGGTLTLPLARVDGPQGWPRLRQAVHARTAPRATTPPMTAVLP